MTREELEKQFLESKKRHFILMLPTSYGKTKFALLKTKQWITDSSSILIVIPRNVLKNNWIDEMKKWKCGDLIERTVFTTYISLYKHCTPDKHWDVVIFDEGHHTSERCQEALQYINTSHTIVLSATLKRELVHYFNSKFHPEILRVGVKDAIENEVLPDPRLVLIPLTLDNTIVNQVIKKNVRKDTEEKDIETISFAEKRKYISYKGPLHILCTQQQYHNDLCNLIEWYKQKSTGNRRMKNMWLHSAGERLKWLAEQKESVVKNILKKLSNYRTLVFCPSIEDSEKLGSPCINSKVGTANLSLFNNRKIKHIAAVGMLDEGCNLIDCKLGIFQMINASDRLNIQRQGRLLRHKSPVLIFPYFKDTREQEIVENIMKGYNTELITELSPNLIDDLKTVL